MDRFTNGGFLPVENPEPKDFIVKKYPVCRYCLEDMGIRVTME